MLRTLPGSWAAPLPLAVWLAAVFPASAGAQAQCESEQLCSVKKPNILLLLDYSSSMSGFMGTPAWFPPGQTVTTRWDAALEASRWILLYGDGLFARNARVALTRFAHDPKPDEPGTTVASDRSFPAITDGFAIDVPFDGSNDAYLECRGSGVEAALEVLRTTPPPMGAFPMGGLAAFDPNSAMLTWTRGALRSAHQLIQRTRANHQGEPGEEQRSYDVVLLTDGDWTCPDRFGQACDENPAPTAGELRADGIPVHVIGFGDATMQPSLNEVALQGGTARAIDANSPQGIVDALSTVLDRIRDGVIAPNCTPKLPRVLITMDASTSMIAGSVPGDSKWDKARFALAGNPAAPRPEDPGYVEPVPARRLQIGSREVAIEDVVHLGMVAFGAADRQQQIVSFGPCLRDNIAWAMDPATSCQPPGCTDPYGESPIEWTFRNSDTDRQPPFVRTTRSYVPSCEETPAGSPRCAGEGPTTFTGQGLEFAQRVIAHYKRNPAPFAIGAQTRFVNVLVTDGQTSQGSSSVEAALRALAAEDIDTYVIGFGGSGEIDRAQLDQYAGWGNTDQAILVDPDEQGAAALADALAGVVMSLDLEACCVLQDCAAQPEPPDPSAVCGDGKVEGGEACDDGAENATYGHCGGLCDQLHLHCGDGRIDGAERCDNGPDEPDDGCDPGCHPIPDAGTNVAGGDAAVLDAGPGPGSVRTLPLPNDSGRRASPSNIPPSGDQLDDSAAGADDEGAAEDEGAAVGRRRSEGCVVARGAGASSLPAWLALLTAYGLRRRRRRR